MLHPVLIMEESLHDQPVVKMSPKPRTLIKPCLRQVRTWEAHGNGPCKLPKGFIGLASSSHPHASAFLHEEH